jgi:O-antigen ligase
MSRSAIISTAISVGIILFFLQKKLFSKIAIFLFLAISVSFLILPISEDLILIFRISEGLSQRDYLWQLAFNIISTNPLVGIGPGAYSYEMFNYFPILLNSYEGQLFIELQKNSLGFNGSHNFYLALFSDLGILGLLVSFLLPYIFIKIAKKTLEFSKILKSEEYKIILGLTSIGIGMFVRGLFEGISLITYGWITVDMPFWIIFLLLILYYEKLKDQLNLDRLNLKRL